MTDITILGRSVTLSDDTTSDGQPIIRQNVPSWAIPVGFGLYMGTIVDETLLAGSMTLRNAGAQTTGLQMAVNIIKPFSFTYEKIIIPTSTGETSVIGSDTFTGGADVSNLIQIDLGDGITRVAGVCFSDYHGWQISEKGRYPSYFVLERDEDGNWSYDSTLSKTADQLYATCDVSFRDDLFEERTNVYAEDYRFNPGMNEMVVCPISGHLLITCYYPSATTNSGSIIAIDPTVSEIVAHIRLPDFTDPTTAHDLEWAPREITVDPSSLTTTRFVALADVFDVDDPDVDCFHTLVEFSYDPATNTFTQVSCPCLPPDTACDYACTGWSDDGHLYAATHFVSDGLPDLASKALNVFRTSEALPDAGEPYGTTTVPSFTIANMGGGGATPIAMEIDADTGTVFTVGMFGGRIRSWTPPNPDADNPNLALNAEFAADINDWQSRFLTCAVAHDAGDGGRLKATGNGSASTMSSRQINVALPVGAIGTSMICRAVVRAGAGVVGVNARVGIDFVDDADVFISGQPGSYLSTVEGAATTLHGNAIVPEDAAGYRVYVEWDSNTGGDIHYVLSNVVMFAPGTDHEQISADSTLYVTGQSNFRKGGLLNNCLIAVVQPYSTTHEYPSAPYELPSYLAIIPLDLISDTFDAPEDIGDSEPRHITTVVGNGIYPSVGSPGQQAIHRIVYPVPEGRTFYRLDEVWYSTTYPSQDVLDSAEVVLMGGHVYYVDSIIRHELDNANLSYDYALAEDGDDNLVSIP